MSSGTGSMGLLVADVTSGFKSVSPLLTDRESNRTPTVSSSQQPTHQLLFPKVNEILCNSTTRTLTENIRPLHMLCSCGLWHSAEG
jgi:hypothetical protein